MSNMTSAPDCESCEGRLHRSVGPAVPAEPRRRRHSRLEGRRSGPRAKSGDECFMHDEPLFLLLLQRLPARPLERVILARPTARRFAPAGGDAALCFEAMQNGIEHPVGPDDLPAREL